MLQLIGLGLCSGEDISVRGKRLVEKSDAVFLEGYTSLLQCTHAELERELGREITVLSREDTEQRVEGLLDRARTEEIALLVIGDPFAATTHADLVLRARAMGIDVGIVHNASILTAIGEIGLELYRFGKTVSIPYWQRGFEPTSFLDGIKGNLEEGLHTLCLLDIKANEGRFMSITEAITHLARAEEKSGIEIDVPLLVGVARIGCPDRRILAGTREQLAKEDFGGPPHSLVIPGRLSEIEQEMLEGKAR